MHNILKQVILITPYPKSGLTYGDLFVYKGEDRMMNSEMEFISQIHKTESVKTYDERMKHYFESAMEDIKSTIKQLQEKGIRYHNILIDMEGK